VYLGIKPYAPKTDSPWPHRYGESRDYQRYTHVPSLAEQKRREWDHDEHIQRLADAAAGKKPHEKALGVDQTPAPPGTVLLPELPPTLREARSRLVIGSAASWSTEFEQDGRSWLLGADLMFFPKDRVAPYKPVSFHGVHFDESIKLPIAFFKKKARPKYAIDGEGKMVANGQQWERLDWVQLTGKSHTYEGANYLETVEPGIFTAASDATVPNPQDHTPWGAPIHQPDTTGRAPKGRGTWLEVSITGGWMVAFEGTTAVFATLISPGRGGPPARGIDPLKTASTPTGQWPVTGKFSTAMMVAPEDLIHSDVPWAQNFHGPHALHGAYWHDQWGEWKSAGCVNLAPIDGRWLFHWTEPPIPEGWHGIRWDDKLGPATWLIVHD
ncbi:MAG: L,D-transpeptidase, partial [Polyangiaceae bacterium]